MPIKNIDTNNIGKTGVKPLFIFIETNDTLAEVTASGYLNNAKSKDGQPISDTMIALVTTKTSDNATPTETHVLSVSKSGNDYSLVEPTMPTLSFDVTVGQAALASAGTVTLVPALAGAQYKIRELYLNSGGTDFSGGGGDRLATISDGTTDYSVIPAATLQSLANARWGDTGLAFPASAAINTSTAVGVAVTIAYSGGATDYTAGSMVISGVLERVA